MKSHACFSQKKLNRYCLQWIRMALYGRPQVGMWLCDSLGHLVYGVSTERLCIVPVLLGWRWLEAIALRLEAIAIRFKAGQDNLLMWPFPGSWAALCGDSWVLGSIDGKANQWFRWVCWLVTNVRLRPILSDDLPVIFTQRKLGVITRLGWSQNIPKSTVPVLEDPFS